MENAIGVRMHANRPSLPMMTPRCSTPGAVGMRSGRDRGWSRLVAIEGNESISARTSVWYWRRIGCSTAAEEEDDGW
jgi:hypothetical protein